MERRKFISLISTVLICCLVIVEDAKAQDCNFSVNAGPGIDVCTGGQVNLGGTIGGDATKAGWRGGKGTFEPNRDTPNAHYTPHPSEAGTTVLLILVASNPDKPNCTPARDEIKIVVNEEVKANAGDDQRICAGKTIPLDGAVNGGKARQVNWISNGSGTFTAPDKMETTYTPSADDLKKGGCSIVFVAQPFGVCQTDSDVMILLIDAAPEITTKPVLNAEAGTDVNLVAVSAGKASYQWRSAGSGSFTNSTSSSTVYKPSSGDIANGTVMVNVIVSSPENKCTSEKEITLHIKPAMKK